MRPIRSRRRRAARMRQKRLITAGFVGGIVAGLVVWSMQLERSRRDLFSSRPLRRLAALGYLRGRPGVETAQILGEYLRWEKNAALRRRGQALLRYVQAAL